MSQSRQLHGSYDVCRHRGSQVRPVPESPSGTPVACAASALFCPYHSRIYGLDRRLLKALHTDLDYNECYNCGPVHPELSRLVPAFVGGGEKLDWQDGVPHREGAWTFTVTGTTTRSPLPGLSEAERTGQPAGLGDLCVGAAGDVLAEPPTRLERDSGSTLVTTVGGLDLFPREAAISHVDYTSSLDEVGIEYDVLDAVTVMGRWPQFRLPPELTALHQADAAIVPAGLGTRVMQDQARRHGADLRELSPVLGARDLVRGEIEVETPHGALHCDGLVVCADTWVNDVLAGLGHEIPLEVTLEQVTYFQPPVPAGFAQDRPPLWTWMDDPSFYGFPVSVRRR